MTNEKEKLQAQLSVTEETIARLQKKINGLVSFAFRLGVSQISTKVRNNVIVLRTQSMSRD